MTDERPVPALDDDEGWERYLAEDDDEDTSPSETISDNVSEEEQGIDVATLAGRYRTYVGSPADECRLHLRGVGLVRPKRAWPNVADMSDHEVLPYASW